MSKIEIWLIKQEWLWITVKYEFGIRYDHIILSYSEHSCGFTKSESINRLIDLLCQGKR